MNRITNKHLEGLVNRLNRITGSPDMPYSRDAEGRLKANIGNFHISGAYGGAALHRMCSEGGGVETPIGGGYVSKRELYERLSAYLRGIEAVAYGDVKVKS